MRCTQFFSILALVGGSFAISVPLYASPDNFYYASVTIGGQELFLFVDTGAPDTWVATNETICYGASGSRTSCSYHFGKRYIPGSTYTPYNDTDSFASLTYADGSEVRGHYGSDDLIIGELELEQARLVIADMEISTSGGQWPTAGLLGLSPELPPESEDEFPGTKASMSKDVNRPFAFAKPRHALAQHQRASVSGNQILTSVFNETDLPHYFGLALSRTSHNSTAGRLNSTYGGQLTIGEMADLDAPEINCTASETFVRVPLIKEKSYFDDSEAYRHWVIPVLGIVTGQDLESAWPYSFNGSARTQADTELSFLVDSGTEVNYLPTLHAALINALFQPPATIAYPGAWIVDCNAKAPELGIVIAGETFPINPLDMVTELELENRTKICTSTIQASAGSDTYVLGMPFLRNVYAEIYFESYDGPESATMWLASREYYTSF